MAFVIEVDKVITVFAASHFSTRTALAVELLLFMLPITDTQIREVNLLSKLNLHNLQWRIITDVCTFFTSSDGNCRSLRLSRYSRLSRHLCILCTAYRLCTLS